jgi:hypothetical protein
MRFRSPRSAYSSGTTEPGSSGAALFTFDGSQYLVRGTLWGGTALCTNPSGTDNFSRIDNVYPSLAPYLSPSSGPAYDFTDPLVESERVRLGLNLIQHPNGIILRHLVHVRREREDDVVPRAIGTWTDSMTYTGTLYAVAGPAFTVTPFNTAM